MKQGTTTYLLIKMIKKDLLSRDKTDKFLLNLLSRKYISLALARKTIDPSFSVHGVKGTTYIHQCVC